MATIYFALQGTSHAREALEKYCRSRPTLLANAVARLTAANAAPQIGVHKQSIVLIDELDAAEIPARAKLIERIATTDPYPDGDGVMFLPYRCEGIELRAKETHEPARARAVAAAEDAPRRLAGLRWGGSVATSQLILTSNQARIGGTEDCELRVDAVDDVVARLDTNFIYAFLKPVGETTRGLLLRSLPPPRTFTGPTPLYIPSSRPTRPAGVVILFSNPKEIPRFARHECCEVDTFGNDPLAHIALLRVRAAPASVLAIAFDPRAVDVGAWLRGLRLLASNVTRSISADPNRITIVAEGAHDDLVVHADAVRVHLGDRGPRIAETLAEPGEAPNDVLKRLDALLLD